MQCLPDAPWIRDAEKFGMPEAEDFNCPVCGAENPDYFYIIDGEVAGCDCCVKRVDAYDEYTRRKER